MDFGSKFMKISAQDPDTTSSGKLVYQLKGPIVPSRNSEGLENINDPPFLVDPKSGQIGLNFDPQKGMKGYFDFDVRVTDPMGHTDESKVQIYLLREDQRVKFVMRSQPHEIRSKVDNFTDALAFITESVVNVDGYKLHESLEDGTVDKTKTDVLTHFVDPKDNTVREVDFVLKLIDYHTEELDGLFKDFNVLLVERASPLNAYASLTSNPDGSEV